MIKPTKSVIAAGGLLLALLAGLAGYGIAPSNGVISDNVVIPEGCQISIPEYGTFSCEQAISMVNDIARRNTDESRLLSLQKQGIACNIYGGEFLANPASCVIDGDTYLWDGDAFTITKSLN
jgi:hypothetical protein